MNIILGRLRFVINLLIINICFFTLHAYANFGAACASPNIASFPTTKLNYLKNNSIYGYVLSLIDVANCGATFSGGCSAQPDNSMNICIKKTGAITDAAANISNSNARNLMQNQSVRLGNITSNPDIIEDRNLTNIMLTLSQVGSQSCLLMPTQYGAMPLICKSLAPGTGTAFADYSQCRTISEGCDLFSSNNNSKTANNFLGSGIQCIYESLDKIFFDPTTCPVSSDQFEAGNATVKPFAEFFGKMQLVVASALTLYLIFFGIRVALNPGEVTLQDGMLAVVKILLVVYFSVGSAFVNIVTGQKKNSNGVTELVLPMMISFADTMSTYVLSNSEANNLCYFDVNDYTEKRYFALWDSFDCRMNIYLGNAKVFWQTKPTGASIVPIPNSPSSRADTVNYAWGDRPDAFQGGNESMSAMKSIAFFTVMTAYLLSGGILLFVVLFIVILIILGMIFGILTSYLVSIMLMYILAYIAPIFVPMALFERTKSYFNNWLNLCMGTAFQPVMIVGLGAYILALIDSFMFDGCVFVKYSYMDLDNENTLKYFFELQLPTATETDCKASIGYKLYRLFQCPEGWKESSYLFFKAVKLDDVWDLEGSVMSGVILCFFMRYVLAQIYTLSAQFSGGLSLGGVAADPAMMINAAVAAAKKAYSKMTGKK